LIPAPPSTLLGMLQRGRGAGWLAALAAPREGARAALLRCVLEDPRRDPQLDDYEGMYAELAEALDLDLAPLAAGIDGAGSARSGELPRAVLGRIAEGDGPRAAEARGILEARPAPVDAGAAASAGTRREPPIPRDLAALGTAELLRLSAASGPRIRVKPLATEWERRTSSEDLALLRDRAAGDADPAVRAAALRFLSLRGEDVFDAVAGDYVRAPRPGWIVGTLLMAATRHDPRISLPLARAWCDSGEEPLRTLGFSILENHGEVEDLPRIATRIEDFLADSGTACPAGLVEVHARLAGAAARPLLERVFADSACSMERAAAAEALARLPGGLPPDRAFECLFDGQAGVVEVGIAHAPPDHPGVRERRAILAARAAPEDAA
jgi:hypothetical protein